MTALGDAFAIIAAVCTGLAGGVYLGFSALVMPALLRRPAGDAIVTMQEVNRAAVRPPFMTVFFGAAIASAALIVVELVGFDGASSALRIAGGVLSLVGFVITAGYNVPRNNELAALDPTAAGAQQTWDRLAGEWTRGNHARAASSALGLVALLVAGHV